MPIDFYSEAFPVDQIQQVLKCHSIFLCDAVSSLNNQSHDLVAVCFIRRSEASRDLGLWTCLPFAELHMFNLRRSSDPRPAQLTADFLEDLSALVRRSPLRRFHTPLLVTTSIPAAHFYAPVHCFLPRLRVWMAWPSHVCLGLCCVVSSNLLYPAEGQPKRPGGFGPPYSTFLWFVNEFRIELDCHVRQLAHDLGQPEPYIAAHCSPCD